MVKILIKAFILVCIVLSIYFIVNPSACSNLMNGRVVNSPEKAPVVEPHETQPHSELLVPQGDKGAETTPADASAAAKQAPAQPAPETVAVVTDTNSNQPQPPADKPAYTQEEADYAIAARYVELENQYIKQNKDASAAAKEISYIVMDDFEMPPAEWEAFLQRATVGNLFEKARAQAAAAK